jgi:predicted RNA-binding protein (virulence factor B family)
MPDIGKVNELDVVRLSEYGLYLDGGELGDILLPRRYVEEGWGVGDCLEVFIFMDSEDRLTASTVKPFSMVDEFGWMRVVAVTAIGAFLDWGLPKDLFVPFRGQQIRMQEGRSYAIRVYLDTLTNRIVATSKLDKFLDKTPAKYAPGEAVALLICAKTDLGFKAIINDSHWGMLFFDKVFQPLQCGQRLEGYIQQVREDGKIGLSLDKPGYEKVGDLSSEILAYLEANGGSMPVTDKSLPQTIYSMFGVSKKTFKKALGALYKARKVTFENGCTQLQS